MRQQLITIVVAGAVVTGAMSLRADTNTPALPSFPAMTNLPATPRPSMPAEAPTTPALATAESVLTTDQQAQANFDTGVQFMQEKKYRSAVEAFQKATAQRPEFFEAFNNWGISLVQLGKASRNPQEQADHFQSAVEKFAEAAKLKPDEKITQMLWSETLLLLGDLPLESRLRLACYQGAIERARRAVALGPDDWEAYNKWAVVLSTKLAPYAVSDQARVQLFLEASDLFGKAAERTRFSGELGPVFANWGSALTRAARLSTDPVQKQSLLRTAQERFERSARAVPNASATYAMWGSALIELGKVSRMRSDLRTAIDKLNTAASLNPKDAGALYNLACAYALMDNTVLAVQNLKQCFELDPTRTYINAAPTDADLATLRGQTSFDELFGARTPAGGLPAYNPRLSGQPQ